MKRQALCKKHLNGEQIFIKIPSPEGIKCFVCGVILPNPSENTELIQMSLIGV